MVLGVELEMFLQFDFIRNRMWHPAKSHFIIFILTIDFLSAATDELKITFWIDRLQEKDFYNDIGSCIKEVSVLNMDVKISDAIIVIGQNEEENIAKLCEILATEGISVIVDWTYHDWEKGILLLKEFGIPYLKVDRVLRPYLNMFSYYMREKKANNVAMIFQNERDKEEALLQMIDGYPFRSLILGVNDSKDFVARLKTLRPSPSYFAIFARGNAMNNIFVRIKKGNLFERPSEWHLVYLDPRDRLFKYRKEAEYATRFAVTYRALCRSMQLKDDFCLSGFTYQRAVLLQILRSLAEIVRLYEGYLVPYAGECNVSITPTMPKSEHFYLFDEFRISNFLTFEDQGDNTKNEVKKLDVNGDNDRTKVDNDKNILRQPLSYNVNVTISFYSNEHEAVTTLAKWENRELHRINQTISAAKRFFRIGTAVSVPWSMYKRNRQTGEILLDTNGEPMWEGYCIDFIAKLAAKLNFEYKIVGPTRGHFGRLNESGRWDGIIGDLVSGETDFIIAALKIYSEREEVIDFLPPYFDQTGISIVMRKPLRRTSLFKFMTVLRVEVWLSIVAALIATALMIWILDRYSPYSYRNNKKAYPYSCRLFTLRESFWFALTSFTPQGGGEAPKAISGRILVAAYWLFVVLMLATFTANLAAFLTVERMQTPVQSLEQLSRQSRINYTVVHESDTHQYFINMKFAEDILYRVWKELALNASKDFQKYRVWDYPVKEQFGHILLAINNSDPVKNSSEGFRKVNEHINADYAFIHDSAEIKYEVTQNCNFTEVGEVFAEQPYAVAVQQGSNLGDELSFAILELQKDRFFEELKEKYWDRTLLDNCPQSESQEGITLDSLGGVFIATIFGLTLAMITLGMEIYYYKKRLLENEEANITQVKPIDPMGSDIIKAWHIIGNGSTLSGKEKLLSGGSNASTLQLTPPPTFEAAMRDTKNLNTKNVAINDYRQWRQGLQMWRDKTGLNQRYGAPDGH